MRAARAARSRRPCWVSPEPDPGAAPQALEERFEALVEPALAAALGRRDGERAGQLAALLAGGGRGAHVARLYTAARLPALQARPRGGPAPFIGGAARCPRSSGCCRVARRARLPGLQRALPVQPTPCRPRDQPTRLHWQCGSRRRVDSRSLAAHCASCRVGAQALWDEYEDGPLAAWLPGFYARVAAAAAAEARWAAGALPDEHPALPLRLLAALFAGLDRPCRARLASALAPGAPAAAARHRGRASHTTHCPTELRERMHTCAGRPCGRPPCAR